MLVGHVKHIGRAGALGMARNQDLKGPLVQSTIIPRTTVLCVENAQVTYIKPQYNCTEINQIDFTIPRDFFELCGLLAGCTCHFSFKSRLRN